MNLEYNEAKGFNNMYASLLRSIVIQAMTAVKQEVKFFGNTSTTFGSLVDGIKFEINSQRRMSVAALSDYCKIETDRNIYANFLHACTDEVICSLVKKEVKNDATA